ncbi:MFS transporter [Ktedonobacter racemifer]|uniref:Major facilitator superfamily MFS_1 n=1 Tax=Ktedonobacter racemifer DSM 44963 TaxID=485913 RepID=D6U2L0_KTERA|nr:MFS transporter [Ktedonobacter racemifer]EFH80974.1 major facilitator superfamily MFS_1 [Ktedonobacter racemifer DSM 44963]
MKDHTTVRMLEPGGGRTSRAARKRGGEGGPRYKWVVLSNTTLGMLMATINSSILLISLPAIFSGIGINPLAPGETNYFLWLLQGYLVVTATLLVTFGRISDIFGRVKLYNLGFAIFTLGSLLLFLAPGSGNTAALELIIFRLIQGVGGGFLFANSTALLTDAFPVHQRGFAMGINQIAAILGSIIGLILGGVLSAINWRFVFLVSVPFGASGTIWAFLMLRETVTNRGHHKIDWLGNLTFAAGLTILLVGITYGTEPYGSSSTGWSNPFVIGSLVGGVVLLVLFVWIELRVSEPMFRLDLFKIRMFAAGNVSGFLASVGRGGLQFMLVIWLQGIWLPLHGYAFEVTPLWSGIYILPLMGGFIVIAPLSGWLSDRFGARMFSTTGMLIQAVGFLGLTFLPANFDYAWFALVLVMLGVGQGMFAAPNTIAIMNSVPTPHRGVASGIRATFQNAAIVMSIGVFFSIITAGLASTLSAALLRGLVQENVPLSIATTISHLPPTSALFAAFLGYNPMATLLPASVLHHLPPPNQAALLSKSFFPNLISSPFMVGLHAVFYLSTMFCLIAAFASLLRGQRYIHESTSA